MPLSVGSYLGPYRLLNLIMTGQSSQVWEVLSDAKQERFALKMLLPDLRSDRQHVAWTRNEFAVGQTLSHPNVIKFVELTQVGPDLLLVLELFRHPNIKHMLLRDPGRLRYIAPKVIEGAAKGLAHLHSKGWVHRDVKPDNFLVSSEGETRLIDFALSTKVPKFMDRLLHRKGKIQGTRSYISPEQIRCQPLEPSSDIYSFGCMLYEMLTGKPPFTGTDTNELLNKHLFSQAPTPAAANPNLTTEMATLMRRCVAKQAAERPKSIDDFLLEFKKLKIWRQPIAPPKEGQGGGEEQAG